MHIAILIVSAFIIFNIGALFGFIICILLKRASSYSGIMKIIREDDKLVYSLELHDDPEMLEFKNEIVFKVETSSQSSNRK